MDVAVPPALAEIAVGEALRVKLCTVRVSEMLCVRLPLVPFTDRV